MKLALQIAVAVALVLAVAMLTWKLYAPDGYLTTLGDEWRAGFWTGLVWTILTRWLWHLGEGGVTAWREDRRRRRVRT